MTTVRKNEDFRVGRTSHSGWLRRTVGQTRLPRAAKAGTGRCCVHVLLIMALLCSSFATAAERSEAGLSTAVDRVLRSMGPAEARGAEHQGPQVDESRTVRSRRGHIRTLVAPQGQSFRAGSGLLARPDAIAMDFLQEHGIAFGISRPLLALHLKRTRRGAGRSRMRLEQTYAGVPVFGAQVLVHLNETGGVEYVSSDIMTDDEVLDFEDRWVDPIVTDVETEAIAIAALAEDHPDPQLQAEPATLMMYQPSVVGNTGPARLVWHTTVTSTPDPWIVERVLVDTADGEVVLRCSLVRDALFRAIYDANGTTIGILKRIEMMPPAGIPDVDDAYDCLGSVYRFYFDLVGRDGIDDTGMTAIACVRVCVPDKPCPWRNACWVGGGHNYLVFGEDFCVDDVTAHEWTHAVAEFTCGLLPFNEAGAIGEFLSDSFGEFADQINDIGNDADEVEWLIGEDLPGGPIRNMKYPAACRHADRKGSKNFLRLPSGVLPAYENDFGYVHSNCGVGNKLCYLLTEGTGNDTFNGYAVTGMGIPKVGTLLYEVLAGDLLTPAADYDDLYTALVTAAERLRWTVEERQNLERACRAVEIAFD